MFHLRFVIPIMMLAVGCGSGEIIHKDILFESTNVSPRELMKNGYSLRQDEYLYYEKIEGDTLYGFAFEKDSALPVGQYWTVRYASCPRQSDLHAFIQQKGGSILAYHYPDSTTFYIQNFFSRHYYRGLISSTRDSCFVSIHFEFPK